MNRVREKEGSPSPVQDAAERRERCRQGALLTPAGVDLSGKDRDVLQEVIALLRGNDFGVELQFTNYR